MYFELFAITNIRCSGGYEGKHLTKDNQLIRVWVRIPSRDTCVLKQDTLRMLRPSDGTQSRWSHVLCNTCKITQCTYQKEKGFAPVFLALAA